MNDFKIRFFRLFERTSARGTTFGEDFYTVGSAFCSRARGFSFFLIDRSSQCF